MFDPAVLWLAAIFLLIVAVLIGIEIGLSIREDWDSDHTTNIDVLPNDEVTT